MAGLGPIPLKSPGEKNPDYVQSDREDPTWSQLLGIEMMKRGDNSPGLEIEGDLNAKVDYGNTAWTVWTSRRVYFPAGYDGTFWVASAPRNPCAEKVKLVGAGCANGS